MTRPGMGRWENWRIGNCKDKERRGARMEVGDDGGVKVLGACKRKV